MFSMCRTQCIRYYDFTLLGLCWKPRNTPCIIAAPQHHHTAFETQKHIEPETEFSQLISLKLEALEVCDQLPKMNQKSSLLLLTEFLLNSVKLFRKHSEIVLTKAFP